MDDKLREVYESDPLAMASAYGVDVVDPDETVEASKAAAQFGWESLPGVGTTYTVRDITSELEKESPNYLKIGALAGAEVIGLIPGLGSAAKSMIRRGADAAKGSDNVIDAASSIPKVPRKVEPSYTDAELLEADDLISEWGKGNFTNPELRTALRNRGFEIQNKMISPKMTGDDLEVVGPDGNIVRWKDMPRGKPATVQIDRDTDALEASRLRNDPEALEQWRTENKLPETQRQKNLPDAQAAAQALIEGSVTSKEARKRIEEAFPAPREYTAEEVMELLPTLTEVQGALGKKGTRYPILGVDGADLAEGQVVSSRLDIPAYDDYNKWVVSIHNGNQKAGTVVGYGQAIRLKNIRFGSDADTALDIARGTRTDRKTLQDAINKKTGEPDKQTKATIARIFGEYTSEDPYDLQRQAADIIASGSDEWVQVGMNPYRGSAFYDKKTGMPVFEAEEIIQVGPLVLARNVKKPTISQMKEMAVRTKDGKLRMFNEGGIAMDKQMEMAFAEGGTLDLDSVPDNTQGVDPVSGNEVPLGSMPEEVRDDIPAQLSEGEYVVPADVVRYYGVKYFEDLRAKAKFGYQDMEENGRIGGEPVGGMEVIEPEDDMMFDISELEVVDDGQPMEMALGGYTGSGGYALSPGDEGYDEMGALGLGIEGISTGYESSGSAPMVEVRAYKNESGHTIYITHIDGKPQTNIPPGYSLQDKTSYQESTTTTAAQPVPQVVSGGDGGTTYAPTPKPVNYKELTTEEIADMLEEQQSPKMNLIATAAGAVNPILGLFIKGAAMASARSLENEIERRIKDEGTSVADKSVLEGLLKASKEEKPGLISRVFGALKDEFFPETEEEAEALEKAKAEDLNSNLSQEEVAPGEVVPVGALEPVAAAYTPTPEPVEPDSPYTGITPEVVTQMENAVSAAAQARKEQQEKQQAELDARIAAMSSTARVKREKEEAAARQAELARQRSANIQQVSDDSGYSIAELGRRAAPSSAMSAGDKAAKAAGATPGAGGQFGMNDGGLASKKKRNKKK